MNGPNYSGQEVAFACKEQLNPTTCFGVLDIPQKFLRVYVVCTLPIDISKLTSHISMRTYASLLPAYTVPLISGMRVLHLHTCFQHTPRRAGRAMPGQPAATCTSPAGPSLWINIYILPPQLEPHPTVSSSGRLPRLAYFSPITHLWTLSIYTFLRTLYVNYTPAPFTTTQPPVFLHYLKRTYELSTPRVQRATRDICRYLRLPEAQATYRVCRPIDFTMFGRLGIAATLHMEEPTAHMSPVYTPRDTIQNSLHCSDLYLDDSTPNSPIEDHTHPPAHATAPMEVPPLSAEDELLGEQFLDDYISGKIPRYKNRLRLEDDDWEQVSVGST